jgi:hypothetical protein
MPKRAWCNGCSSYVMLTAEDLCPYGHPKPSLRAVEEVGYGAPPSQPERKPPTDTAPYASEGFTPATATASAAFAGGMTYYGGDSGPTEAGNGSYGESYGAAQPTSSFAAAGVTGGYGTSAPVAAAAAPAAAWQTAPAAGNPWQTDIDAVTIDPMLQMQLNQDALRLDRNVPWTESWAGIIVFLFILWPAGLIFLWRSSVPTTNQKWVITGTIGGLIAFNVIRMMLAFAAASATMPVVHR